MLWLGIIFLLSVLIVTYIIFAPFYVEVDSEQSFIELRFHRLASMRLVLINGSLNGYLKIGPWIKQLKIQPGENKIETPVASTKKNEFPKVSVYKMKAVIKSFKVNRFHLNIDTGDMQWNGMLFPLFIYISETSGKDFRINFTGEYQLQVEIKNSIARIIWAFI